MIRFLSLIVLITVNVCSLANVRVLSIGISEYPESSDWNKLNAHNDVQLMLSIFPNATSIENASATRSGIIDQLRRLSKKAAKGDTIIIHFSGHGQQIITENATSEPDEVDEAIIPFDAAKRKTNSYEGQNHLTDDAFGKEIDQIRKVVGPNGLVIALIDACHSGSMDRTTDTSADNYRGTDEIFGVENMSDEKIKSLKTAYHKQDTSALRTSSGMSNAVLLSACESDQRNYEINKDGKRYGSLTYYFCEAYRKDGFSDLPKLLNTIYSGMQKDQTLKHHGQLPSIRNTIGWRAPISPPLEPIENRRINNDPQKNNTSIMIWSLVSVLILVIVIVLWIKKKVKK